MNKDIIRKTGILNKKGFIAASLPYIIIFVIMTFVIVIFYLVFSLVHETTNEIVSYENEPTMMNDLLLYSMLEGEISINENYLQSDTQGPWEYNGKELISIYFDDEKMSKGKLEDYLKTIIGQIEENIGIRVIIYKDGNNEMSFEINDFSTDYDKYKRDGLTIRYVDSNSEVKYPVKDGILNIIVQVREFYD